MSLYAARAALRAAELEVKEREIPLTRGTSNSRLYASKRLRAARELAAGWQAMLALAELEQRAEERGAKP